MEFALLMLRTILTSDGNLNESDSIYVGSVEENEKNFEIGVIATIKCAIAAIELLEYRLWEFRLESY